MNKYSKVILGPPNVDEYDDLWVEFVERFAEAFWVENQSCHNDHSTTRAVLEAMNENWPPWKSMQVDIEGTIAHMESLGGYCDCEVLLNILMKDVTFWIWRDGMLDPDCVESF